jgi:hypothetical protein
VISQPEGAGVKPLAFVPRRGWLDDLLLPHPVTTTPTISALTAKPAAMTDTFVTIGSFAVWSAVAGVSRDIADRSSNGREFMSISNPP